MPIREALTIRVRPIHARHHDLADEILRALRGRYNVEDASAIFLADRVVLIKGTVDNLHTAVSVYGYVSGMVHGWRMANGQAEESDFGIGM